MSKHECKEIDYCVCSVVALEPSEDCPIHTGTGPWPPRCATCGKFIKRKLEDDAPMTPNTEQDAKLLALNIVESWAREVRQSPIKVGSLQERIAQTILAERERVRQETIEACAVIAEDDWKLDAHNEGHPGFEAKYGTVDIEKAIRALADRS